LPDQSTFIPLLIITMLAALVPALSAQFRRFRVPVVIGEILAGIIIGRSGLDLVKPGPILEFLAEFGFVLLMFLSGLEVDLRALARRGFFQERRRFWQSPLFLALIGFGLTLAGAAALAFTLGEKGFFRSPFIMGLILSTTSLGIVVPVLKERGLIAKPYGQLMLVAAVVADFITLIILSVVFGVLRKGLVPQLLLLLLLSAFFALSLRLGLRASRVPGLRSLVKELSTGTAQMRVRMAIALMVAWAALAHALGTEVILGAFMAGVIVSLVAGPEESMLREKLDALGYGFFIPIFFISVGCRFDLEAMLGSRQGLVLFPLLLAAAYAVKLVPALVYRLAFSWRESIAGGFLLSSRLSLIIAASALALDQGLISDAVNANIILVAMVTCTLSPILFLRTAPKAAGAERRGYLVVGLNQLTGPLVERLLRDGEEVTLLGRPEDKPAAPVFPGVTPHFGDPKDEKFLEDLGAGRAAGLVAAMFDSGLNLSVCRLAAHRFGIPVIVARADNHAVMQAMNALGARVIQPALATAVALEGALRFPATFDMLADHGDNVEIGDVIMRNLMLDGRPLREIRFPGNALVMGLRREGEVLVPHGDTVLRLGDMVMLVGSPESVNQAGALLTAHSRWSEP